MLRGFLLSISHPKTSFGLQMALLSPGQKSACPSGACIGIVMAMLVLRSEALLRRVVPASASLPDAKSSYFRHQSRVWDDF